MEGVRNVFVARRGVCNINTTLKIKKKLLEGFADITDGWELSPSTSKLLPLITGYTEYSSNAINSII